jgi:hypothetical protein
VGRSKTPHELSHMHPPRGSADRRSLGTIVSGFTPVQVPVAVHDARRHRREASASRADT